MNSLLSKRVVVPGLEKNRVLTCKNRSGEIVSNENVLLEDDGSMTVNNLTVTGTLTGGGGGGGGTPTLAQVLAEGNDANDIRITGVAEPVSLTDAVTLGHFEGGRFFCCYTNLGAVPNTSNLTGLGAVNSILGGYLITSGSPFSLIQNSIFIGNNQGLNANNIALFDNVCIGNGNFLDSAYCNVLGTSVAVNVGCEGSIVIGTQTTLNANNANCVCIGSGSAISSAEMCSIGTQTTVGAGCNETVTLGNGITINSGCSGCVAIGKDSYINANTPEGIVIGIGAGLGGGCDQSVLIGNYATISDTCTYATAIGGGVSVTSGTEVTVIGNGAVGSANYCVALGTGATGSAEGSIAIGQLVNASAFGAVSIGANSGASASGAIALGVGSTSSGTNAISIGSGGASGLSSIAIGSGASASAEGAIALGQMSNAILQNSIGFDSNLTYSDTNAVPTNSVYRLRIDILGVAHYIPIYL